MSRFSKTLLTLAAVLVAAPVPDASANCRPGDGVCVGASVTVTTPRARVFIQRRPQTYVVQAPAPRPTGRVIVVQPAPPPPPARIVVQAPPPPPQPRVVVVQQPPPPPEQTVVVVREPQPQQYTPPPPPPAQPAPAPVTLTPAEPRHRRFGIHTHLGGVFGQDVHMGGWTGGLRVRPSPRVGLDFGVGVYGGTDWNGWDRMEVPLTFDTLVYLNPDSKAQVYTLFGVGVSWSRAEDWRTWETREFTHLGGEVGLGLEWRIAQAFALNTDVRGFMRYKIDGSDQFAEFVDPVTGETSNTSAGVLGTFGATFYF